MAVSSEDLDKIRSRVRLAELASDRVQLKHTGKEHVGLCPFHQEKTPSFHINDEDGLYYCFGCGAKGTLFDFVMNTRGFTFPEAVTYLANKAGIELTRRNSDNDWQAKERAKRLKQLRDVTLAATKVYRQELLHGKSSESAREYVKRRGIDEATSEKFLLGFAPESWDFCRERIEEQLKSQTSGSVVESESLSKMLLELGLIRTRAKQGEEEVSQSGRSPYYDTFRNRLMFPITRSDGHPIAFGGRVLADRDGTPKYINSSESLLYLKRKTFYGVSQALSSLRSEKHVYITEGYMDVISLVKSGVHSVVATCGTSLTQEHIDILKRFIHRASLMFDGDKAGRQALARAFELFINSGIEVQAVILPEGEDPDSLASTRNAEELVQIFKKASQPLIDVYIDQLLEQYVSEHGSLGAVGYGKVGDRVASVLARIKNAVEREMLEKRTAVKLGIGEQALSSLVRDRIQAGQKEQSFRNAKPWQGAPSARESVEKTAVTFVAQINRDSTKSLDTFSRQLLVAVVSDPRLARSVLEMESVVGDESPYGALSEAVIQCIREFSNADIPGMAELIDIEGEQAVISMGELEMVLNRHQFDGASILRECVRQLRIGGAKPKELVEEAQMVLGKTALKTAQENLRRQVAAHTDDEEKSRLAQEKLEKRRLEERLKSQKIK